MQRAIATIVLGILGGVVGVGITLQQPARPSLSPYGNLDKLSEAIIGGFAGSGIGVFLAIVLVGFLRRINPAKSDQPRQRQKSRPSPPVISPLFLHCITACSLLTITVFCVSFYFSAWNFTGNWEYALAGNTLTRVIWKATNVAAPYLATCGLCAIVQRSTGLVLLVMAVQLAMVSLFVMLHLGYYQQVFVQNRTPSGAYAMDAGFLCIFEWGIVFLAACVSIGSLMSRRGQE